MAKPFVGEIPTPFQIPHPIRKASITAKHGRCGRPNQQDRLWPCLAQDLRQKWQTVGNLFRRGPAIARWTTTHDIGAAVMHPTKQTLLFQEPMQGPTGSPDEALALPIFIGPWGFSDHQQSAGPSPFGKIGKHDPGTGSAKALALAAIGWTDHHPRDTITNSAQKPGSQDGPTLNESSIPPLARQPTPWNLSIAAGGCWPNPHTAMPSPR